MPRPTLPVLLLLLADTLRADDSGDWRHRELRRFPAAEANQGVAVEGQAFAWDPVENGVLYSISRHHREVIVSEVLRQSTLPIRGFCAHRGAMATHPENTIPAFVPLGRELGLIWNAKP